MVRDRCAKCSLYLLLDKPVNAKKELLIEVEEILTQVNPLAITAIAIITKEILKDKFKSQFFPGEISHHLRGNNDITP